MESVADTIKSLAELEDKGEISPDCKTCVEAFYSVMLAGKKFSEIYAPHHKASKNCESGKRNHCTCDVCF